MSEPPVKTALFVDFDNIYLSLRRSDPRAAERFATQPQRWLSWLAAGRHRARGDDGGEAPRPAEGRLLVRRCYLTPTSFGSYRSYFTRGGFTVVDCPPLTSRGKNSADIVMVMDMLDALEHQTRFDEFVILSGDADFTPLLLRLRAHDRRTAILTNEITAAAYRAATDTPIGQDDFMEEALGIVDDDGAAAQPSELMQDGNGMDLAPVAERVVEALRDSGPASIGALVPVFQQFPAFANSHWFGAGSLRRLCERLVALRPEIVVEEDGFGAVLARAAEANAAAPEAARAGAASPSSPEAILDAVRAELAASEKPLDMAVLGNVLIRSLGPRVKEEMWGGAGTLGELIRRANDPGLAIHVGGSGFLYDPRRHSVESLPPPAMAADLDDLDPALAALIQKITSVTGCPRLGPDEFRAAFEAIAAHGFSPERNALSETGMLRDMAAERGFAISRRAFSFMLVGFNLQGFDVSEVASAADLAAVFKENILDLCANAALPLSERERALIDQWLGVDAPAARGDPGRAGAAMAGERSAVAHAPERE